MVKTFLLAAISFALVTTSYAKEDLLTVLYDNNGWEKLLETEDGITISTKKIDGYDIKAVEVSQVVNVDPYSVVGVLEDVESYNDVLGENRNMVCNLVEEGQGTITGYQFYKIPLIRDRYVIFEMKKNYYSPLGDLRSEWVLVPQEKHTDLSLPDFHYEKNPLSIDEGAGIWLFKSVKDGKWRMTHRLYMNPGGWIPDFIVDRVNRKGISELFKDVIQAAHERNEVAELMELK